MFWLLDADVFVTRHHCGAFTPGLVFWWCFASIGLWVTYTAIAGILVRFWLSAAQPIERSRRFPSWTLLPIAGFFLGCAGGHLKNALAFTWPAYRFFTLWDCLTLIVSAVGFYAVWSIYTWATRVIRGLERERDLAREQLQAERDEARHRNQVLDRQVEGLVRDLEKARREASDAEHAALIARVRALHTGA